MKKRGNGEGSIYKRKNGTFSGQLTIGRDSTGRLLRKTVYGKSRAEVMKKLDDLKYKVNHGLYIGAKNMTVGEWLPIWLLQVKRNQIRGSSYKVYEVNIHKHLIPVLGSIKLTDLKAIHVTKMLNDLLEHGNIKTGTGLSGRTVKFLYTILREALNEAVFNSLVTRNICLQVKPPRFASKRIQTLSEEEVKQFLMAIKDDRLFPAYYLLLSTGLRRGELLGLRHEDVDFKAQMLRVEQTLLNNLDRGKDSAKTYILGQPKTESSRRTIFITDSAVLELRKMFILQKEEQLKHPSYNNDLNLVFTEVDGSPIGPNKFSYRFKRLIRQSGIDRNVRLHDLRHTVASYLLNSNANPKMVQELLGHSTISTTLDIYSHITTEAKKQTSIQLEGLVIGGEK